MSDHLLRDLALGDAEIELASTRRMLEAVPDAQLDWRPHERSRTLRELATHLARIPEWAPLIVGQDGFDLARPTPRGAPAVSRDELLAIFDERATAMKRALADVSDEALREPWTLRRGDLVIQQVSRAQMLRRFVVSHLVHHRAQVGVYLRQVGARVPGMYGPSADEQ